MEDTMKMRKFNEILIGVFVLTSVLLPGDIYHIKKVLFIVLCLVNVKVIIAEAKERKNIFFIFFGFIFPLLLFIYSWFLTGEIASSFARSFSPFIFLLILPIRFYKIDYEKILIRVIYLIVVLTLSIVFLDLINIINVNSGFVRSIMYKYDIGLMGKSSIYPFIYKVFFKTSPLLVVILFKSLNDSRVFSLLMVGLTLILSGTRANVLFPMILLIVFFFFYKKDSYVKQKQLLLLVLILLSIFYAETLYDKLFEIFIHKGMTSDAVRVGHLKSLGELINRNPLLLITGTGMGSEFFSYGTNSFVSSIELSFVDLWRQMGIIFFSVFVFFAVNPLFVKSIPNYKKFALLTYLLIASTNPLLFNSTSYILFIYIYQNISIEPKGKII